MILTEVSNIGEPVSIYELADHLRIDCEDDTLVMYLSGARRAAESYTHRSFTETQYTTSLNGFCFPVEIPIAPLKQIDSIEYYNELDVLTSFTDYYVDTSETFPVITQKPNTSLPVVFDKPGSVVITFTTQGNLPDDVKSAILLMGAHLYENRENEIIGAIAGKLTMNAEWLLNHHRIYHT